MNIPFLLETNPHNSHYLKRYMSFMIYCKLKNNGLIKRTKRNAHGIYMELHHILPKSKDMFPEYTSFKLFPWNRIDLTARQHFIAHWMLWKAYSGLQASAFAFFTGITPFREYYCKLTSKTYENLRKDISEENTKRLTCTKYKKGRFAWNKGLRGYKTKPKNEESKKKTSLSLKNKPKTEQHKNNISKRIVTDETKKRMSIAQRHRYRKIEIPS